MANSEKTTATGPGQKPVSNSLPPVEDVTVPGDAVEPAKIANDSLVEIVYKYPDRKGIISM